MARAQDVGTYLLIFVSDILQRISLLPHSDIPHSVSKKAFRTLAVHGVAIEGGVFLLGQARCVSTGSGWLCLYWVRLAVFFTGSGWLCFYWVRHAVFLLV